MNRFCIQSLCPKAKISPAIAITHEKSGTQPKLLVCLLDLSKVAARASTRGMGLDSWALHRSLHLLNGIRSNFTVSLEFLIAGTGLAKETRDLGLSMGV